MSNKMDFFDWCAQDIGEDSGWVRSFVTRDAWAALTHDGDCTKQAQTCTLCLLEGMLRDYREHCFQKPDNSALTTGK